MKSRNGLPTNDDLLESLHTATAILGHSPSKRELASLSLSGRTHSPDVYRKRFGSFNAAKRLAGLDSNPVDRLLKGTRTKGACKTPKPKRPEKASRRLSMRFRVLMRDGFRCTYCGATPESGARLELDHAIPESAGGRTCDDNLRTACADCNLGKGAVLYDLESMARRTD